MDLVKFTGQAKHVVEQKPNVFAEYSERDDLFQKYVKRIMSSGTYFIPRDVVKLLDQENLDKIQNRIQQAATGGDTICTSIEDDFENDRYIVRWWTE